MKQRSQKEKFATKLLARMKARHSATLDSMQQIEAHQKYLDIVTWVFDLNSGGSIVLLPNVLWNKTRRYVRLLTLPQLYQLEALLNSAKK